MTKFALGSLSNLPAGWTTIAAGRFRQQRSQTFKPATAKDTSYELYSVPSHATGKPEIVSPSEIGSNKQYVAPGSVLISKINPRLNRTWRVGSKGAFTQIASTEWIVFPKSDVLDPGFLKRLLSDYRLRDFLAANSSGVGGSLTRIRPDLFDKIQLPLPPFNEQKRIVEKIEAMFDEIDKGAESLQTARTTLALYRQSLLKSAFEGYLTADWRTLNASNMEAPETLFARIQKERDTRYKGALDDWQTALKKWRANGEKGKKPGKPRRQAKFEFQAQETPSLWPTVRVEAILTAPLINGRSVKSKAGGFPVLRLTALKKGKIFLSENKEGSWTEDDARPFLVEREDIFLARGNGSKKLVGIGGRVMEKPMPVAFPDTMIRVRLDTSAVRPDFFLLAWNSWTVRSQIEEAARTTAGIYKINQDHVSSFSLPLPCLAEQAEIARILESRLEAADALEAEINTVLDRADALRQSILKKAFSGRLVPQDPDDEPAPALLERISAAVAAVPKIKRRKAKA